MKKLGLVAAGVLFAVPAWAQTVSTQDFVQRAATSDMLEIESSRLAIRKKADEDTRPFARRMIAEHQKTSRELKGLVRRARINAQIPRSLDAANKAKLDRLKGLSGKEFDTAYDRMQQEAHQDAVNLFQTYSQSGDNPQLKEWAAKTVPALQEHLSMARNLK